MLKYVMKFQLLSHTLLTDGEVRGYLIEWELAVDN